MFARFGVLSQPALVLITRTGVVTTRLGAIDDARFESALRALTQ